MADLARCVMGTNIIACYGARGIVRRKVLHCPTCQRRTPFVVRWDGAYYGTTEYCTVCLDGWQEDERLTRPFKRGWKVERAEHIRELWDSAMLPAEYRRWTDFDVHCATCHDDSGECPECLADPRTERREAQG